MTTPTMWTYNGPSLKLSRPDPNFFTHFEVLANSLGNQARFFGHTRRRYSVAEHSWHCWAVAPPRYRFAALLHDVHESVVGDVTAPWKALLPEYVEHERKWQEAAAVAFGLDWTPELTTAVSVIDKALLATELRDLVNKSASEVDQEIGILPLPLSLYPVSCADWGRLWQDRLEWALYEENEEFDPDEMPQQYADTDQEFAWRATRRRIADDIKARLAALVELDPTPVDVKNPPLS